MNLPDNEERKAIFDVHLKRRNKSVTALSSLVKATAGFNGADIESVVVEAIETCFLKDQCAVSEQELLLIAQQTVSISKSCKE